MQPQLIDPQKGLGARKCEPGLMIATESVQHFRILTTPSPKSRDGTEQAMMRRLDVLSQEQKLCCRCRIMRIGLTHLIRGQPAESVGLQLADLHIRLRFAHGCHCRSGMKDGLR